MSKQIFKRQQVFCSSGSTSWKWMYTCFFFFYLLLKLAHDQIIHLLYPLFVILVRRWACALKLACATLTGKLICDGSLAPCLTMQVQQGEWKVVTRQVDNYTHPLSSPSKSNGATGMLQRTSSTRHGEISQHQRISDLKIELHLLL